LIIFLAKCCSLQTLWVDSFSMNLSTLDLARLPRITAPHLESLHLQVADDGLISLPLFDAPRLRHLGILVTLDLPVGTLQEHALSVTGTPAFPDLRTFSFDNCRQPVDATCIVDFVRAHKKLVAVRFPVAVAAEVIRMITPVPLSSGSAAGNDGAAEKPTCGIRLIALRIDPYASPPSHIPTISALCPFLDICPNLRVEWSYSPNAKAPAEVVELQKAYPGRVFCSDDCSETDDWARVIRSCDSGLL